MFRITFDPTSGSLVQCLAKNYKNGSIVSVQRTGLNLYKNYKNGSIVSVQRTRLNLFC